MSDKTVQIIEILLAIIAALKGIDKLNDSRRKPVPPQTRQQAPYRVPAYDAPRRLQPVEDEIPVSPVIPVTPFNPRGWR